MQQQLTHTERRQAKPAEHVHIHRLTVGDLEQVPPLLRGALHAEPRPGPDLVAQERHVEPDEVEPPRIVAQHRLGPAHGLHVAAILMATRRGYLPG